MANFPYGVHGQSKFAEEKKITQIKPQEYPSSLKKEQILKLWIEIQ